MAIIKGTFACRLLVATLVAPLIAMASPSTSKANSILVGQCIEFDACWNGPGPTPWTDTLSLTDLTSLGLGTTQPFIAAQTSQFGIQLGVTSITFDISGGGTVTQTLGEFSGGFNLDPCNYCEIDTVGSFLIPVGALDVRISGTFGNSVFDSSAGVDLWLGPIPSAPGPVVGAGVPGLIFGSGGLLARWLQRRRKRADSHAARKFGPSQQRSPDRQS
jgi:hypothetical protein